MLARRQFLTRFAAALAAPAIIRTPGLLMPISPGRPLGARWHLLTPIPFQPPSETLVALLEVEERARRMVEQWVGMTQPAVAAWPPGQYPQLVFGSCGA